MKKTFIFSGVILFCGAVMCQDIQEAGIAVGGSVDVVAAESQLANDASITIVRSTSSAGVDKLPAQTNAVFATTTSFAGKPVKNAPFFAESITESIQILADGNRISTNSKSVIYRDSEGRVRRESELPQWRNAAASAAGGSHKMIVIEDPVAGVHYFLNDEQKTATKISVIRRGMPHRTESMPVPSGIVAATPTVHAAPAIPFQPTMMGRLVDTDQAANIESLGTQIIGGVSAKGTRTSFTIPEGAIGNERKIVSTNEVWTSEDLGLPVLTKRNDPRFGETSSRMTNIQRVEQPSYLFEVPSDYKVIEGGRDMFRVEQIKKEKE